MKDKEAMKEELKTIIDGLRSWWEIGDKGLQGFVKRLAKIERQLDDELQEERSREDSSGGDI